MNSTAHVDEEVHGKVLEVDLHGSPPPPHAANPTYDEIAFEAYFIALERNSRGEAADPLKDWIEAERQLLSAGT